MDGAKPIKLMKPGSVTSVEGTKVNFTEADLQGAAAAYDAAGDPAPIVVGHPNLDAPAFGWIDRVVYEDGHLCAVPDPAKLDPAFAEAVNAGRYSKVSARFYLPGDPNSPNPDGLYLKHVGFLGGAAPAVKGLGTVAFSEERDGAAVTIEQPNEEREMTDTPNKEVSFAEREAAIEKKERELKALEQTASQALHKANVSFAEQLVTTVQLAPAGKDLLVGLLDTLDGVAQGTVSFGEAHPSISPGDALRKLIGGAQPLIALGERARDDRRPEDTKTASFAAPDGYDVDAKRLEIHAKAVELQAANPKLSYVDAVRQAGG